MDSKDIRDLTRAVNNLNQTNKRVALVLEALNENLVVVGRQMIEEKSDQSSGNGQ